MMIYPGGATLHAAHPDATDPFADDPGIEMGDQVMGKGELA
jgi:hypothetical protein